MKRLRWPLAAFLAIVAVPGMVLLVNPPRGHADGWEVSLDGTICWEGDKPDGGETGTMAAEGAEHTGPSVVVTLSEAQEEAVTVRLSTKDGTAVAPDDYEAISDLEVTIPAKELSVEVPLVIRWDDVREDDEWFLVYLHDPSKGGAIGEGEATVTIKDGAPPERR